MLYFYLCQTCGNLVMKIEDGGNTPFCCGKQMTTLRPASTDGAVEKHVPVVHIENLTADDKATAMKKLCVEVGSTPHPSESYHYIQWIVVETNYGAHLAHLKPGDDPRAIFYIRADETLENAYAYCNLHGLWKC